MKSIMMNRVNNTLRAYRVSAIRMMRIGILTIVALQMPGCGLLAPGDDYEGRVEEAWILFHEGDYPLAELHFTEALIIDTDRSEAWLGRGWSRLLQEEEAEAATDFIAGHDRAVNTTDFQAGLTLVHYLMEHYLETIESATRVLDSNSSYRFSHLQEYDNLDIRFLRASASFASGESRFAAVITDINVLAADLALGFELSASDSATWFIAGMSYDTLPAVLTAALDIISGIVS